METQVTRYGMLPNVSVSFSTSRLGPVIGISSLQDVYKSQYVNRLIGYQITLPDSYQAVSGNSVSLPENAQYDMVAAAPDGNSIIVTAVINMSELDGENWSDEELAYYFKRCV